MWSRCVDRLTAAASIVRVASCPLHPPVVAGFIQSGRPSLGAAVLVGNEAAVLEDQASARRLAPLP